MASSRGSPDPIGVLQITVLEARSLPAADFSFAGGSSDPYVVVRIGQSSWQTAKRHKTLAPVWGPAHCMERASRLILASECLIEGYNKAITRLL